MTGFGQRLLAAMDQRQPVCVGIDPHPHLLRAWGLPDSAQGVGQFASLVVAALGGAVAALKPQSAFFERHGSAGVAALEQTIAAARAAGALVVLDVKRGDIGSTMTAYAQAYLTPSSALAADAITVSPYLGVGALQPAFEVAAQHGAGVFVLAATSNPEAAQLQAARIADGRSLAQLVTDEVGTRNAGASPLGDAGLVLGATIEAAPSGLVDFNGPLLVPGIGAQGGSAQDLITLFGPAVRQVLASVSRSVLDAGPDAGALLRASSAQAEQLRAARNG